MRNELGTVSVIEGFYPQFSELFRQHYGPTSVFVYATADMFTTALARMLTAKGVLADDVVVPALGPEGARDGVSDLTKTVTSGLNILLQEAFGAIPPSSFASVVDQDLGVGCFARWLAAIEQHDYDKAKELLANGSNRHRT